MSREEGAGRSGLSIVARVVICLSAGLWKPVTDNVLGSPYQGAKFH